MTRTKMNRPLAFLALAAVLALPARAAKLGGKSFSDSATVGGKKLVLNGLGMREATVFKVDVYAGGLYLPAKSKDAKAIITTDQPWRLELKFVRDVDKSDMTKAFSKGFAKNAAGAAALKPKIAKRNGMMRDIDDGSSMALSYVPDKGTSLELAGKKVGTIKGADFAKGLLSVWLGKKPPNAGLKRGLLGS